MPYDRPSRVLAYGRVSRTADNSTSLDRQLTEARELGQRRWSGVPVLDFRDDGVSGAVDPPDRPGFRSLMAEWQPGDAVVFWRLDRLARSVIGFSSIVRTAQDAGVVLVSVCDPLDLSTADGRMIANVLATFAEFEREMIRARVSATRRTLHKTGRWPGGRAPYGLMPVPHPEGEGKALARDPEAATVIREIVKRVTDGEGITAIARDLQERGLPSPRIHTSVKANPKPSAWSSASVRDVLGHPNVVGHQVDPVTGRIVRENGLPVEVWEPVVSIQERDHAMAALPAITGRAATSGKHWLYGVATCACGRNLHTSTGYKTMAPSFKCYGTKLEPHPCTSARIVDVEELVETAVLEALGGSLYAERKYVGGSDPAADVERLRAFLEELEDDRKAGMYSTDEGRSRFRRQYQETEAAIAALAAQPAVRSGWQSVHTDEYLADVWARRTPEQRGDWLRQSGVSLAISRPAVKRARIPLSDRAAMDWGSLEDLVLELDSVRVDAS